MRHFSKCGRNAGAASSIAPVAGERPGGNQARRYTGLKQFAVPFLMSRAHQGAALPRAITSPTVPFTFWKACQQPAPEMQRLFMKV